MLPPDLQTAESEAFLALRAALAEQAQGLWSLEWRFEGLRLLPVALRLLDRLVADGIDAALLFPDAGAAALACRDAPALAGRISSFSDHSRRQAAEAGEAAEAPEVAEAPEAGAGSDQVLILVAASQPDYETVEGLAARHRGGLVLLNPSLLDAAVGIGRVARQRRRGLLSQIRTAYALQPLSGAALRRAHPGDWELYRLDTDGYRFAASFADRPDAEALDQALAGDSGLSLSRGLQRLDDLLDGLQR